jgi:ferredoxin
MGSKLNIDFGSCVRVASKYSECSKCADICPINAITYNENILTLDESCIDCGGCIGICPTEAISLSDFHTIDFIFDFLKEDDSLISCKKNIPCLALLSIENLISLALLGDKETLLDLGHCKNCEIKEPLYQQIVNNIQETNHFLKALGSDKKIVSKELSYTQEEEKEEANRRDFLKRFSLKGAIESKISLEKELEEIDKRGSIDNSTTAKMREKNLPNKRKLLYMALKRVKEQPHLVTLPEASISFISQKSIDNSCDNCSFCYRLCPTGALNSDKKGTKIEFDALACVKCHLCHDVCQTNSLHLESFETASIFKPKIDELIKFTMKRCEECGLFFTYFGDESMCRRCTIEEEEAKSLWGIQ